MLVRCFVFGVLCSVFCVHATQHRGTSFELEEPLSETGGNAALDTPDVASIDAEEQQYMSIATVESLTTGGPTDTLIHQALSDAQKEERKASTKGEDDGFQKLANQVSDDFDDATGVTGGATGNSDATGATGAMGAADGTGATGATGATANDGMTGSATATGDASEAAASEATGAALPAAPAHFPDADPAAAIDDVEGTTQAITFSLIFEGIQRLKASSVQKLSESVAAYIGLEAECISIESIRPIANDKSKRLRRLLAHVQSTKGMSITIKITTMQASEVQSAVNNLGDPKTKADAVASLLDLMHANGLDSAENIFVQESPVATVVSVEKPKAALPVPVLTDPAHSIVPVESTVDMNDVLAGLPDGAPLMGGGATGGGAGTGGTGGAAYHGVVDTVAPTGSEEYAAGKPVGQVLTGGNSGHWSYILRSHGGKSHNDAATLLRYGLSTAEVQHTDKK
jgi:hypothetical protein